MLWTELKDERKGAGISAVEELAQETGLDRRVLLTIEAGDIGIDEPTQTRIRAGIARLASEKAAIAQERLVGAVEKDAA